MNERNTEKYSSSLIKFDMYSIEANVYGVLIEKNH